jgi:lipid A 3-O-deacylase
MRAFYPGLRTGSVAAAFWALIITGFVGFAPMPALAEPPEELAPFFAITEFRFGVFDANLENAGQDDVEFALNAELLFGRLGTERGNSGNPILDVLLHPRPHIGFSIAPGEGTDQLYAGLTWEVRLTDRIFVEASFGGAVHDGSTDAGDPESFGCTANFRESASIGIDLTDRLRVMATIDHMSNGGLCDENEGLTNAGVRLGYRW